MEFSKKTTIIIVSLAWCGVIANYVLAFLGLNPNEVVTGFLINGIIVVFFGYLIYQYKLKDSRNRWGIDEDGPPYILNEGEDDEEDEEDEEIKPNPKIKPKTRKAK